MKGKETTYIVDCREEGAIGPWWKGLRGIAVIAAFGLVSLGWFRGDFSAVAGYDFATSLKPLDEIRRALHIWDDRLYAGAPNFIAVATLPYLLLQYAFERMAGSLYRGQMYFFTLLFLLPGFSMRTFLRCAFANSEKRDEIAFFGALFYMLNTFVFVKWNRGELIALFAYGMLPLYLAIVERGLKGPVNMHSEREARSFLRGQASESDMDTSLHVEDSQRQAAGSFNARFVILFICALFFYPASLGHSADFLITTGLICGYALWRAASAKDLRVLKRAVFLAVAAIAVSSWWALPFLSSMRAGGAGLTSFTGQETGLVDYYSSWARLLNVMKLWFSPIYPTAVEFGLQFYRPGAVLIPMLAFSALLFKRDGKVIFFSFAAIIGLWLSKGTSPPFGGIYRWLYLNLPYFFVFRAPSRCFPLVYTLALSVLIGYSASSIRSMARTLWRFGRLTPVLSALIVLLILFNAWPLLYRDTVFRTRDNDVLYPSVFINIPSYYEEMNGWIRERVNGYRLHSFHDNAYLNYTWGYSSTDIAPKVIEAPQTLKFSQELTFGSGGFHELMGAFARRFWSWDFGRADRILGLFGVKYIFSTKDVMRRYLPDTNYYEMLPCALASMDGIRQVKKIGQGTIYENSRAMPLIYVGGAAKALFADVEALITLSHTEYLDSPLFIRMERLDQADTVLPKGGIDELVIADRNFYDVLSENIPNEYRFATGEGAAFRSKGGLYAVRARMGEYGHGTPLKVSVDGRPVAQGADDKRLNGIRWADLGVIDAPEGWHNVSIEPSDGARELIFVPISVWESEKRRVEDFFRNNTLPLANIFRERVASARSGIVLPVFLTGPYNVEASFTRGVFKEKDAGLREDYVKDPSLLNWSVFGGGGIGADNGVRITPGVGKDSVKAAKRFGHDNRGYVDIEEYPYLSIRAGSGPSPFFDTEIVLGMDFDNDGRADDAIRLGPLKGNSPQPLVNLAEMVKKRYGYPGRPSYRAVWVLFDLNMHSERPARSLPRGRASESDMDTSLRVGGPSGKAAGSFKGRKDVKGKSAVSPSFRVEGIEFYRYVPVIKPYGSAQAALEISAGKETVRASKGPGALKDILPAALDNSGVRPSGVERIVVRARSNDKEGFDDALSLQDIVVKVSGKRGPAPTERLPEIEWRKLSPAKYSALVKRPDAAAQGPFWMVLNVSYDKGWKAYILKDGKETELRSHYRINGFANGWWVDKTADHEITVVMEYAPQGWLFWGTVASISSSVFLIGASVFGPLLRKARRGFEI
ncbi:MAG: hypothetical protein HZB22_07510 [Deltaproteobacteria bacterium]|nr:hypothetical protein [Deltaproteobacteria bacterium]